MKRIICIGIVLCILLGWANTADVPSVRQASATGWILAEAAEPDGFEIQECYDVPILLYHHFSDTLENFTTSKKLAEDLAALKAAGYETIFFDDLYHYVHFGEPLPEKPLIITFDDGYLSNYTIAYPLLKQFGMKAEIAIIGSLLGQSLGGDDWREKSCYFSWEQAKEMQDSGVVRLQNHTYNMHVNYTTKKTDMPDCTRQPEQTFQDYQGHFFTDHRRMLSLFSKELKSVPTALIYPLGQYDDDSEALAAQMGYAVTATTELGINRITYGEPESLKLLKRICCDNYQGSVTELLQNYENPGTAEVSKTGEM